MAELDPDRLVLITVGAELKAEVADRPLAYALQRSIAAWLTRRAGAMASGGEGAVELAPVVLTDIWYLNNEDLHACPLISVGGPGVNAVSSFLQSRLPTALHIEQQLVIQLDVELEDLRASVWGMNYQQTAAAVDLFEKRYLDPFMLAVAGE